MAMRRPRIKVAANLSIRRPTKNSSTVPGTEANALSAVENVKDEQKEIPVKKEPVAKPESSGSCKEKSNEATKMGIKHDFPPVGGELTSPTTDISAFKFPRPVEEPPQITTPAPASFATTEINGEEPHSPKKLDSKFAYINALNNPRKRIRTESMTSNKSYSDVSLKSRKTIKLEEFQKASDAKRDLRKRLNNIQNVDKQSLTIFDMIYYNPMKNPMKSPALSKKGSLENIHLADRESRSVSKSRSPTPAPMPPPPEPPKSLPQLTPQLKLGPNGEMILDEASLVIENEREKEMRDTLAKTEIVYDDEFSGNSGYYSRFKRTRDWPPAETIRFYRCLHTIGTDFSMMIQLFPNRSRRDLKLKFKKEERLNLKLINKALLCPKEFNIEELKQQFQEEDEEIERQREQTRQMELEAEEKIKEQKQAKMLQLHQSKNRNPKKRVSRAARVMLDDDNLVKTEPLLKEPKPRRRKRKANVEDSSPATASTAVSETHATGAQGEHEVRHELPAYNSAIEDDCDVDDTPYIPNGDISQLDKADHPTLAFESDQIQTGDTLSEPKSQEAVLDIDAMEIDIIGDTPLYELNRSTAIPAGIYENKNPDSANVIVLQNLDDHSQTTVPYQEPAVKDRISDETNGGSDIDSLREKYYSTCDAVYMPMPANAPVAHLVKTDQFSQLSQPISVAPPQKSPVTFQVSSTISSAQLPEKIDITSSQFEPSRAPSQPSPPPTKQLDTNPVYLENIETNSLSNPSSSTMDDDMTSNDEAKDVSLQQERIELKSEAVPEGASPTRPSDSREDDEQPRGLGLLENIDINSLVLVESQDITNPNKTIYEIYVIDPETDKLSEKPLDVPQDVIENIRTILEVGED